MGPHELNTIVNITKVHLTKETNEDPSPNTDDKGYSDYDGI